MKKHYPTYKNVLLISENANNEVILFVDFSEFDIPLGHIFSTARDVVTGLNYNCEIVLKSVSQQFVKEFDAIPHGWKTICKFEIIDDAVFNIIRELPEIESWYDSTNSFIFYGVY